MNKSTWNDFLNELKINYKKNGVLSEVEKKQLDKNKRIAIDEGFITAKDLNEIAKMSVDVKAAKADTKKGPQMNFAGRGGPRSFVGGEKAKDGKKTIGRLLS